ncbi:MAG: hypothetical protein JWO05_2847 [Gemmatimonadetes bacterium]|nr:hypothetical protein [Gemmatimonadota bacterium]
MDFTRPTYVVVDMPGAVGTFVRGMRERFSPRLAPLPVEITLVGSSGVGVFAPDTVPGEALAAVERLAELTAPLPVSFDAMTTFEGSGVFYYPPTDPAPWRHLHQVLAHSGLRYLPTPFSFTPHLTAVRLAPSQLENSTAEVLALPSPPSGVADTLSVYSLAGYDCTLLYRTLLRGAV